MKIKTLFLTGCLMVCMIGPTAFAQADEFHMDVFVGYSLMRPAKYDNIDLEQVRLSAILSNDAGYGIIPEKYGFLPKGFSAAATYKFTPFLGIDAAFRYNSGNILHTDGRIRRIGQYGGVNFEAGYKKTNVAFLVGPRLTGGKVLGYFNPFVYGLAGISNDRLSGTYDLRSVNDDYWWSDQRIENCADEECPGVSRLIKNHNSFAVALGGGLDIPINDNWAIRAIQAEYFTAGHPRYIGNAKDIGTKRFDNLNLSVGVVYRFTGYW